jgi:hypothetical protein
MPNCLRVVAFGRILIAAKLTVRDDMVELCFDHQHSLPISRVSPQELEINPTPFECRDFGKDLSGCQTATVNTKFSVAKP